MDLICYRCKERYTDGACGCADGITLFCGDCRDVLPALPPEIACTVTSPPYNQMSAMHGDSSGLWSKSAGGLGFIENWKANGYADKKPEKEYQDEQHEIAGAVFAVTKDGGSLFYNHQLRWRDSVCLHPVIWFRPYGFSLRSEIIWDRGGGMMFNARMFVRFDERILWYTKGGSWKWNQDMVGKGTVWRIARVQQQQGEKYHPVAFPIEIPKRCIAATTDAGDTVLDPFAGSGTTLVASKLLGRKCIGIELEERYCRAAASRLAQEVLAFNDHPRVQD